MIDEKKLIECMKSEANMDRSRVYGEHECDLIEGTIRMCIDVVKAQPQVANDTNVGSRREWYQKGYQDGLNANIPQPYKKEGAE